MHEPPPLQLISTCGARSIDGHAPLRMIEMRSESADVVPCARHEPQYLRRRARGAR